MAYNMIMDMAILTLPMPFVWRLNMPRRQKIAVSAIFLLVNIAPTLYWTVIEAAIAVVSACLPTLRPLFTGISLEALQDFASKFSLRSGNKSSGSLASNPGIAANSKWQLLFPNQSLLSSAKIVNRVEAVCNPSSEDIPVELRDQSGIAVSKVIYQQHHDV
ncbi:hypothetical protein MFIFM68171_05895 [Madurella fahalii]|uniref:Rhodopsin domain-containing protein n=1 Tax=Madurella fahalii TaxID=1157608 RepID=A0ABQ0GDB6_9PEZI